MRSVLATLLAVCFLLAPLRGHAVLVPTDQAGDDRSVVAQALRDFGVDPRAAAERAQALTEEEAARFAEEIRTAPAGAHVGTAFVVFAIIALLVWFYTQR